MDIKEEPEDENTPAFYKDEKMDFENVKCEMATQWSNCTENFAANMLPIKKEETDIAECSYSDEKSYSQMTPLNDIEDTNSNCIFAMKKEENHYELKFDEVAIKKEYVDYEKPSLINSTKCIKKNNFNSNIQLANLNAVVNMQRLLIYERNFVCGFCFDVFPSSNEQKLHELGHENSINCKYLIPEKNTHPDDLGKCNNGQIRKTYNVTTHSAKETLEGSESNGKCVSLKSFNGQKTSQIEENPFKCEECRYTSTRSRDLKRHKMIHSGERLFKCDECDYKCTRSDNIRVHKSTHTGEKPFKCVDCSYAFTRSRDLKRHKMTHSGEKLFSCDECDYKCKRSDNIRVHKSTHSGEKPFKCVECDYAFQRSSDLKRHKMTHSGERCFKCNECEYTCALSNSLKVHKRTHTGEKPFKCDECDYTCRQSSYLKVHKRSHSGEKPFMCGECNYKSAVLWSLKQHKRTHSGEKPYKCDECDFRCAVLWYIKVHKRTHPEKSF